jgi:hypothetical protein
VTIQTADGLSVTLTHLGGIEVKKGERVAEGAVVGPIGPSGEPEFERPYVHMGVRVTDDPDGYLDPVTLLPPRAATAPPPPPPPSPQPQPAPAPVPAPAPAPEPAPAPAPAPPHASPSPEPEPSPPASEDQPEPGPPAPADAAPPQEQAAVPATPAAGATDDALALPAPNSIGSPRTAPAASRVPAGTVSPQRPRPERAFATISAGSTAAPRAGGRASASLFARISRAAERPRENLVSADAGPAGNGSKERRNTPVANSAPRESAAIARFHHGVPAESSLPWLALLGVVAAIGAAAIGVLRRRAAHRNAPAYHPRRCATT